MLLVPGQKEITQTVLFFFTFVYVLKYRGELEHNWQNGGLPMCAEALCLRPNEFAVYTSRHTKTYVQPVLCALRHDFALVCHIILCRQQFSSIIISNNS